MSKIGSKIVGGMERIGMVRNYKNPPVKTTDDPKDTFDTFKGVNLGIIKLGKFEDIDSGVKTENVKDKKGAAQLEKQLKGMNIYKDVKVSPDAERITEQKSDELFEGVVLFNRWKIGSHTIEKTSQAKTQYNVSAKIPISVGGTADMNSKMSRVDPKKWSSHTWFEFFKK